VDLTAQDIAEIAAITTVSTSRKRKQGQLPDVYVKYQKRLREKEEEQTSIITNSLGKSYNKK
jgi:hypothetical protein